MVYIYGTAGNDSLSGTVQGDRIYGGDGDDYIVDLITGRDRIWGDAGNDTIGSGIDADDIFGGSGNDVIYGGGGGDGGGDVIYADDGNDLVYGDYLTSTRTNGVVAYGGTGDDTITVPLKGFGIGWPSERGTMLLMAVRMEMF